METPHFTAAIFDLDGTITDTPPLHLETFNQIFAPYDVHITTETWLKLYEGTGSVNIFNDILTKHGLVGRVSIDELRTKRQGLFKELAMKQLVPVKGFGRFLDELNIMNIPSIVATNGAGVNVALCLHILKLDKEERVTAEEAGKFKPDPAIYTLACERLGKQPGECVVFEDSVPGVMAAKRAGCYCVCVMTTNARETLEEAGADLVVQDFTKLAPGLLFTKS